LLQAVVAVRTGATLVFASGLGLENAEVSQALATRRPRARPAFGWSQAMSPNGGLFGLRQFHHSQTWRIRYDPRLAEDGALPAALDLSMRLAPHPQGADWQISVTLDDHLLDFLVVPSGQQTLRQRVALPLTLTGRASTIEITATSTYLRAGSCSDAPDLMAEVLAQTQMVEADTRVQGPIATVREALAARVQIPVSSDAGLTAAEATVAAMLLEAVLPQDHRATASSNAGVIRVLPIGAGLPDATTENLWLIYRDPTDNRWVATPRARVLIDETDAVTLLIDLSEDAI